MHAVVENLSRKISAKQQIRQSVHDDAVTHLAQTDGLFVMQSLHCGADQIGGGLHGVKFSSQPGQLILLIKQGKESQEPNMP